MSKILKNNPTQSVAAHEQEYLVDAFMHTEESIHSLPALSDVERVQLEHEIAISHLYHSSKIEGTTLNKTRLEKAIAS